MIVVSVHDVSESRLDELRWLLARLDQIGGRPRVLKVIPAEGGRPLGPHAPLAELLRAELAAGSEIVLHGWDHRAAGPARGRLVDRVRAALFAPDDAEFLTLAPDEAAARIDRGRDLLAAAGVPPVGFCPPAWLAVGEVPEILRRAGFEYLVVLTGLLELRSGRFRRLLPFGYMGAGGLHERLVGLGGRVARMVAAGRDLRCFLHPAGAPTSPDAARVLGQLTNLLSQHRPVTYRQLLADARAIS